jgi:hypothetical protein
MHGVTHHSSGVQRWATGWIIGGSSPDRGWEFFFFTAASTPAPGPTQPPTYWVPGALSLGVKQPECEADHSHLVPRSKNAWNHTSTLQ